MEILAWTVLLLAATSGVLLVPFGLAGQFLYPIGILGYLLLVGEAWPISWTQLWIFLGIAVVVEALDSVLGMLGGRKAASVVALLCTSFAMLFLMRAASPLRSWVYMAMRSTSFRLAVSTIAFATESKMMTSQLHRSESPSN